MDDKILSQGKVIIVHPQQRVTTPHSAQFLGKATIYTYRPIKTRRDKNYVRVIFEIVPEEVLLYFRFLKKFKGTKLTADERVHIICRFYENLGIMKPIHDIPDDIDLKLYMYRSHYTTNGKDCTDDLMGGPLSATEYTMNADTYTSPDNKLSVRIIHVQADQYLINQYINVLEKLGPNIFQIECFYFNVTSLNLETVYMSVFSEWKHDQIIQYDDNEIISLGCQVISGDDKITIPINCIDDYDKTINNIVL